jgi:hypothetical protein
VLSHQRITIGFDRANTFRPLSKFMEGREWFVGNTAQGDGGHEGKRGDKVVVEKGKVRKPGEASQPPTQAHNQVTGGSGGSTASFVIGKITERSPATDNSNRSCV